MKSEFEDLIIASRETKSDPLMKSKEKIKSSWTEDRTKGIADRMTLMHSAKVLEKGNRYFNHSIPKQMSYNQFHEKTIYRDR